LILQVTSYSLQQYWLRLEQALPLELMEAILGVDEKGVFKGTNTGEEAV
jgi:hypothetical protein